MWPLAAASPCGSGASGSCHCGWAPWLTGPADMGRAKGGRQTRRGSGAAGHPPATGPETLPQSPCHPGRAQNAPEPAGPGPCPCPGREPVSAPLRALAQPSAQPAAPRRSPSGPGAQPGPKHSPRRADGGGWSPPGRSSTPTHLPPLQMADRKRKRRRPRTPEVRQRRPMGRAVGTAQ